MSKLLFLQAALYTAIAALTPWGTYLASETAITSRSISCIAVSSFIAGATALKAFLSTTFSDSSASDTDKPKAVEVTNTAEHPVLTQQTY